MTDVEVIDIGMIDLCRGAGIPPSATEVAAPRT